ncbi:hypothetical protein DL771_000813 [Monosporascus sp. 5C6A]|nr:hypothetical protein DL771_000813 [Monosporascus sp. 5C6A]
MSPSTPAAPYLNLPRSTCDAIAAHQPVTYSADLGPHLWDTGNEADNNARRVDISVLFVRPNLMLDCPLVDDGPKPSFPCNAASDGYYSLGRDFLQDAFFGANFETSTYRPEQAPGPKIAGEQDTWTSLPGGSGKDGGDDAGAASGAGLRAPRSAWAVGVKCGALLLALAGLVAWRYGWHGKGPQMCGATLLGNRGYGAARTGDDGDDGGSGEGPAEAVDMHGQRAGGPKTYYGGGSDGGGQKPYETGGPDPVRGRGAAAPRRGPGGGRDGGAARGVFGLRDGGR